MSKFGIMDIVELAKNGYTPKDVKDILTLAQSVPSDEHQGAADEPDQTHTTPPANDEPESAANATANAQQSDGDNLEDSIDYKKKFEEAQKLIEKLQADNVSRNVAEQTDTSAADKLTDSFRRIMS